MPITKSEQAAIDALLLRACRGRLEANECDPVLSQLAKAGVLVKEDGQGIWRLPEKGGCVIGLDLGGTKLLGAIADLSGEILAELSAPTRHDGEEATLLQLEGIARDLAKKAGRPFDAVMGIGLGVPGSICIDTGTIVLSPNLALSTDLPIDHMLSELCDGIPVYLDNDVNLAVQGEYWRGEGMRLGLPDMTIGSKSSLAFLSLGTGVGLGLMIDGINVRGASGGAGEIAYMPATCNPFAAAKASFGGAYEDIVGSPGIRRRYGAQDVSVRDIFDRAEQGEQKAIDVIDETARQVAVGAATIATLIDPQVIVLGGGIGARADFAQSVMRYAQALMPTKPRMAISRLGPRAGVVGAVMNALLEIREILLTGPMPGQGSGGASGKGRHDTCPHQEGEVRVARG